MDVITRLLYDWVTLSEVLHIRKERRPRAWTSCGCLADALHDIRCGTILIGPYYVGRSIGMSDY